MFMSEAKRGSPQRRRGRGEDSGIRGFWDVSVSAVRSSFAGFGMSTRLFCFYVIVSNVTWCLAGEDPLLTSDGWPGFRQNAQLTGVATSELPGKLTLKWKHSTTDGVPGSAAVVGGRVYLPVLDGEVWCLDVKTGEKLWAYPSRPEVPTNGFLPGFKAAPLVAGELVVIGDEEGMMHGIDRQTGMRKWVFETNGEIISSATLVPPTEGQAERIVVGSYDNHLYCLELLTGKKVWSFASEGYVNCTPAVAGNLTFVAGCDEDFRVIDLTSGEQQAILPLGAYLIGSPAVWKEDVYIGTYAGELISLNWKTLERNWTYALDESRPYEIHSSAAVTEKYVLIGGQDKKLHCVDRASGKRVWELSTKGHVDSSPVVVGKRVFVGSKDGNLYEVELDSGKVLTKTFVGRNTVASPAVGENVLIIGSANAGGEVHCYGE